MKIKANVLAQCAARVCVQRLSCHTLVGIFQILSKKYQAFLKWNNDPIRHQKLFFWIRNSQELVVTIWVNYIHIFGLDFCLFRRQKCLMIYGQHLEIPTLVCQPFCKARQFFFFLSFFQLLFKEKGPLCALQKEKALPESWGLVIKSI